jgi:proline iminopeptidase
MKALLVFAVTIACATASAQTRRTAHESRIAVNGAELYVREVGQGIPVIVLHGGPDFDSSYLLPEMDRLGDKFHLIYYDQRGRGRSAERVRPEDVTLESEMADLDAVREHFHLEKVALLGHSWGTVLALEYALRYPERVSRLVLMDPAPASTADVVRFRDERAQKWPVLMELKNAIAQTNAYKEADPDAVVAYYRQHFKPAFARPEAYEQLILKMQARFIEQGKDGILKSRAIEDRLVNETWAAPPPQHAQERRELGAPASGGYDLHPKLKALSIPTLVITGDHDFFPFAAEHIAQAIPGAQLVTLKDCGHFPYLECPDLLRPQIDEFFRAR